MQWPWLKNVKDARSMRTWHINQEHLWKPSGSLVLLINGGLTSQDFFPFGKGQKKFIVVAVEYFTKWVEAEALGKITKNEVMNFVWKNIVCRFGIPRILISDNGTQFQGKKIMQWCEEMKIEQRFTSIGHPQANGQTEVTNKIILQHLKTRLTDAKGY